VLLQAAKTKQAIKEEEMQITVVERSQKIQIQEQEIIRRERELDAKVRKPAEAEKFRLEKIAEANKSVNDAWLCRLNFHSHCYRRRYCFCHNRCFGEIKVVMS